MCSRSNKRGRGRTRTQLATHFVVKHIFGLENAGDPWVGNEDVENRCRHSKRVGGGWTDDVEMPQKCCMGRRASGDVAILATSPISCVV